MVYTCSSFQPLGHWLKVLKVTKRKVHWLKFSQSYVTRLSQNQGQQDGSAAATKSDDYNSYPRIHTVEENWLPGLVLWPPNVPVMWVLRNQQHKKIVDYSHQNADKKMKSHKIQKDIHKP